MRPLFALPSLAGLLCVIFGKGRERQGGSDANQQGACLLRVLCLRADAALAPAGGTTRVVFALALLLQALDETLTNPPGPLPANPPMPDGVPGGPRATEGSVDGRSPSLTTAQLCAAAVEAAVLDCWGKAMKTPVCARGHALLQIRRSLRPVALWMIDWLGVSPIAYRNASQV